MSEAKMSSFWKGFRYGILLAGYFTLPLGIGLIAWIVAKHLR